MTNANHIHLHEIPEATMHIASLAVQVLPDQLSATRDWLTQLTGVEIHGEDPMGKLVVVMESQHERAITHLMDKIAARPGVVNAALVYHEILTEEPTP